MVGGGRPLLPEILDQTDPPPFQKRASTLTRSENDQLHVSRLRAFQ